MPNKVEEGVPRGWEEYLAIVVRRRWWIVLPLFLTWLAVWGGSWFLPTTYTSDALVSAEQEKVSDIYVMENVNVNLQNRLQSTTQKVLSYASLEKIIAQFKLYATPPRFSGFFKPKDPVDQMRGDIKIELVGAPGYRGEFFTFKIHYSADTPALAQQVNTELTSLFINENVRAQRQLSENTTAFLDSELADARTKMEEQEAAVSAFKAKHVGNLPGQLQSNVQILAGLQAEMASTQHALDTSKQQKIYLESLLQQYQSAQASLGNDSDAISTQAIDKELQELRMRLQNLRTRYTDGHPDMVALEDEIAKTEALRKKNDAEIASNQQVGKSKNPIDFSAAEGVQRGTPTAVMQLQSQLKANQLEIQNEQQHANDLEAQTSAYQARLNLTPETEQELTVVSRGYDEAKFNYNSLLQKQTQSQLATSLGQEQQGQQFHIVDPPKLPDKPSAPNRFLISLVGLALGAGLGFGIATLLELTDVRFRQEKDLEGILPARLLVGIPRLSTPQEDHFRVVARYLEFGAAAVVALLIFTANLYTYYNG
ncbi:MAG TPA: GNVR domain-containing protein [Candidatus Acidoferrum sp.]|nr:GNVR domain-containing protein [Candidatus Acidoferrum sp.]